MNIGYARDLLTSEALQNLDCLPYLPIVDKVHTMARPRFLATMNKLAQCLRRDEIYLEVGSYQGGSLIGTLLNNNAKAIAVDSFTSWPENNGIEIINNFTKQFNVNARMTLIAKDFHDYFADPELKLNIGLYYYDGAHDEQSTYEGLEAAWQFISEDYGMIVLDDTYLQCVCNGINHFIGNHYNRLRIAYAVSPFSQYHPDWWNGTIFLHKMPLGSQ